MDAKRLLHTLKEDGQAANLLAHYCSEALKDIGLLKNWLEIYQRTAKGNHRDTLNYADAGSVGHVAGELDQLVKWVLETESKTTR